MHVRENDVPMRVGPSVVLTSNGTSGSGKDGVDIDIIQESCSYYGTAENTDPAYYIQSLALPTQKTYDGSDRQHEAPPENTHQRSQAAQVLYHIDSPGQFRRSFPFMCAATAGARCGPLSNESRTVPCKPATSRSTDPALLARPHQASEEGAVS